MPAMTDAPAGVSPRKADGPSPEGPPLSSLTAFDEAAWQSLFAYYHPRLYRFACVRTGDTSAAEEITAEVFLAAAKGIARYRPTGAPFGAWLFRIARNLVADHLDRRRRRPLVSIESLELLSSGWDGAIDDTSDLARALANLTGAQQEVLVLRFFGDCSLEETAGAMGKRVGAIKVLQHRALAAMRRELTRGER